MFDDNSGLDFSPIYSAEIFETYTITGLTPSLKYLFRTTASNSIGESNPSSEVAWFAASLP